MSTPSASNNTLAFALGLTIIVLLIAIWSLVEKDIPQKKPSVSPVTAAAIRFADATTSNTIPPIPLATTTVVVTENIQPITPDPEVETGTKTYIEVTDGCAAHYQGECLLVRSGPGKQFPVVSKLRNGVVLRASIATTTASGTIWYKIKFDEWLRYPERVTGSWYVSGDYVTVYQEPVIADYIPGVSPTTTKRITVNRTTQQLAAYDGDELFMTATTSTGLDNTPTPRGIFTIFKKTPSRYMQGPLPGVDSTQVYDLPGVPWNLYFTNEGAVIHGAYWHTAFGTPYSHGCVNLSLADAHKIYDWAPVGTVVTIHD